MVIKIPKKKTASSNEPQTFPESSPAKAATSTPIAIPSNDKLIPFIDRISVVLPISDDDEDALSIYGHTLLQWEKSAVFKNAPKGVWGPYKQARRVALDCLVDPKKWPLLQYAFDKEAQHAIEFRTEFSPVDLGLKGLKEYHKQLSSLMLGGWSYFVEYGRVTMIEVTVDVPNLNVEDFHVLPAQGPSAMMWKANGKLETLVLGKSNGNQTRVYDRGKKRVAKGQGWTGPPTTRIERRLRLAKPMPLIQLPSLKNPFAGLQMIVPTVGPPPKTPKSKAYEWTLFLDSAKVRGLSSALKLLPEERRTAYRKWLGMHPVSWWQPEAIWTHWPGVMDSLKIASPSYWI